MTTKVMPMHRMAKEKYFKCEEGDCIQRPQRMLQRSDL